MLYRSLSCSLACLHSVAESLSHYWMQDLTLSQSIAVASFESSLFDQTPFDHYVASRIPQLAFIIPKL